MHRVPTGVVLGAQPQSHVGLMDEPMLASHRLRSWIMHEHCLTSVTEVFYIHNLPESVFLLLPQVEVPLDNVPHMFGLLVREPGEIQLLPGGCARHNEECVVLGNKEKMGCFKDMCNMGRIYKHWTISYYKLVAVAVHRNHSKQGHLHSFSIFYQFYARLCAVPALNQLVKGSMITVHIPVPL